VLAALQARSEAMVDDLARLVAAESPSEHLDAVRDCVDVAGAMLERELGVAPERVEAAGRIHLRLHLEGRADVAPVALLGHLDTVWPLGTTERWPFTVEGRTASGPGVFDMKAGVVQGLHALAALGDDRDVPIEVLLTTDEELGSPTSRELVEGTAARAQAVLVLEPSAEGALKLARKGVSRYRVTVTGRAAHTGLDPEHGVNALEELAHQVLALRSLSDAGVGTTVIPTVATAGTAPNVVPAEAHLEVDVRAATTDELRRVDDGVRALSPHVDGCLVDITGGINRPPFEREASEGLYARVASLCERLGIEVPDGVAVGGGSDGNFTAAVGTPTLDGLGAVGGGAHAEGEWIALDAMPERAALVVALVVDATDT
jgi:glutamate carboxypeptidase